MYAKINRCLLICPFYGGCPHFGESVKRGSTVIKEVAHFAIVVLEYSAIAVLILTVPLLSYSPQILVLQFPTTSLPPNSLCPFSQVYYRRSGFNCENAIIANCKFISSSLKLERKKRCTQSIVRYDSYEANQQATNAEPSRAA